VVDKAGVLAAPVCHFWLALPPIGRKFYSVVECSRTADRQRKAFEDVCSLCFPKGDALAGLPTRRETSIVCNITVVHRRITIFGNVAKPPETFVGPGSTFVGHRLDVRMAGLYGCRLGRTVRRTNRRQVARVVWANLI